MPGSLQPVCVAGGAGVPGPAGSLEVLIGCPEGSPRGVAVICHPHPLYGGSLHNKVVHTLARVFAERGCICVRFNFRGVGASAGEFGHATGEAEDLAAVVQWARRGAGDLPLWLAGFSFGAAVAASAARGLKAAGLVTVAPAVSSIPPSAGPVNPGCPWLLVQGELDEVVSAAEVSGWVAGLPVQPRMALYPEAGHFFHGQINGLRERLHAELDGLDATAGG